MNVLANLARMTSTTQGTGTLTLGAAVAGCNTFAAAGVTDGQAVTYAIEDYSENGAVSAREIGVGTYTSANLTLTRTTVYSSTNAGAKINCSGRQHVFITAAKEDFDTFLTTSAALSLYQPLDADLTTLAANITAFGHSLVDDADAATARSTLQLGTMATETATDYLTTAAAAAAYQPLDGDLTALAGLSGTSTIYYRSALNTWSAVTVSANLGFSGGTLGSALGTAATKDTGTSGNTVPLLDAQNTFSANQLIVKANANMNIVASTGNATHYVASTAGTAADIRWSHWNGSAVVDRWLFGKNTTAESGSDAGSAFDCYSYTDAGAFKLNIFRFTRAGDLNFFQGVRSNGVTGGNMGAGTANFATLYESGVSLASKYQPLDGDLTALAALSGTNTIYYRSAANTWTAVTIGANLSFSGGTLSATGGGGLSDADYGDITVSGVGTVMTIDNDAVTYAKIQNVTANSVLARAAGTDGDVSAVALSASQLLGRGATGDVAAITLGSGLSMSGATLSATGGSGVTRGQAVAHAALMTIN